MVDARIYVSHTKRYPTLRNTLFMPIQAGCAQADLLLPDMERDNTKEHISGDYPQWGDLTALYWVWKNTQHAYTGWMSSHRFLSLSESICDDGSISKFPSQFVRHYGWTAKHARRVIESCDLVVPRAYPVQDLTILPEVSSPYAFYVREGGTKQELDLLLALLCEKYPEKYVHALEFLHGSVMRPWHMFVMKQNLFHEYGDFLFTVLVEFKKRSGMEGRIGFQRHNWLFLAEILLNIEVKYHLDKSMNIKVRETPIIYIDSNDFSFNRDKIIKNIIHSEKKVKSSSPKEIMFDNKVRIVISFNDRYFKPACATINSILSHTANKSDIVFYIIHDKGLSNHTQNKLCEQYKGVDFVFLPVKRSFVHKFPLNRSYININTYYRLLIHKVLPKDIERVLYLDTDISVCSDVVDLWNTDMGSNIIAGAPDESGAMGAWRLFEEQHCQSYINAGVFLFDLKNARHKYHNIDFLYVRSFYENQKNITMQDQDILNIAYKDDIMLLPLSWNVPSSVYYRKSSHSEGDYEGRGSVYSLADEVFARENPKIIHFTGRKKPWKLNNMHPLKRVFWHFLKKTASLSIKEHVSSRNSFFNLKKGRIIIRSRCQANEYPFRSAQERLRRKRI